jgi:hypothetical protein
MADNPRDQIGVDLPEPTPVETPEVEAPELELPERPEWLPEKFKDVDEYNNSYRSLEEELRQRGVTQNEQAAQIDELRGVVEALQQPQYQQPQYQNQQQLQEQLLTAYEADPIGTMIFLSQQAAQQAAQQAIQGYQQQYQPQQQQQQVMAGELMASQAERVLEARYQDWNEYAPKVGDLLEKNQHLLTPETLTSVEDTARVLEAVYKQVKYDDVVSQLESNGNDQTRMKEQAQTVSGGAGRPGQPTPEEEKISRLIAAAKNTSYAAFRGGG